MGHGYQLCGELPVHRHYLDQPPSPCGTTYSSAKYLPEPAPRHVSERMQRVARRRSLVVLAIFTTAMLVAFLTPRLGFSLTSGALILHLRQRLLALGSQINDNVANRL
jgi:hypothetical protein